MTLLEAMARQEGFYLHGSRAQRNNNPLNIEWGKFAEAHGATNPEEPLKRFAVFPTAEMGFSAARALLTAPTYRGKTVQQALNRWAPPVENDLSAYVKNVCTWAGCQPTTVIDSLIVK
jgi:hypothetical protein